MIVYYFNSILLQKFTSRLLAHEIITRIGSQLSDLQQQLPVFIVQLQRCEPENRLESFDPGLYRSRRWDYIWVY